MAWLPEAEPQDQTEVEAEPASPEIADAARAQGVTSVVHFTRTSALTGILDAGAVKARRDLPADERLKHVYAENASDRSRDLDWHGYVNLSISSINVEFFNYSKAWHPDAQWVILKFAPDVLAHPGVVFCTTNNAHTYCHRARGLAGFEQMFAPVVPWGHYGSTKNRASRASHQTTCEQAEALYPEALTLEYLHTITVGDEETYETVYAVLSHFPYDPTIDIDPEAFE